jgi:capsular polysaccharide biosynthesis protein
MMALGVSGFYSYFVVVQLYEADTLLYIWQENTDSGSVQYNDLMLYSQLVNDYQVFVKSRLVTDKVIKELNLDLVSASSLANKIAVRTKNNTRHLVISVTDSDPVFAAAVANKTADVFSEMVVVKMGAANVQIIDQAIEPTVPTYPNRRLNLAIGLVIGIMAGFLIIVIIEFFDIKIKNADDIESITGYTQLGAIPELHEHKSYQGGRSV